MLWCGIFVLGAGCCYSLFDVVGGRSCDCLGIVEEQSLGSVQCLVPAYFWCLGVLVYVSLASNQVYSTVQSPWYPLPIESIGLSSLRICWFVLSWSGVCMSRFLDWYCKSWILSIFVYISFNYFIVSILAWKHIYTPKSTIIRKEELN